MKNNTITLHFYSLIILVLVSLTLPLFWTMTAVAEDPVTNQGGTGVSITDLEDIARNKGYAGGRAQGDNDDRDSGQNWFSKNVYDVYGRGENAGMESASIKGDKVLYDQLKEKGLKLEDSIDDPKTDMQAMLLRDTKTNKLIIVFRGTEVSRSGDVKADLVDGATAKEGVGHDQYTNNSKQLEEWAQQARKEGSKLTVTGHSLGGALGQRFVNDFPEDVDEAVLFNSAGLGPGTARDMELEQAGEDKVMPKIKFIDNPNDAVPKISGGRLSGDTYHVTGGATGLKESHSEDFFTGENKELKIQKVKDQDGGWIPENERQEPEKVGEYLNKNEKSKLRQAVDEPDKASQKIVKKNDEQAGQNGVAKEGEVEQETDKNNQFTVAEDKTDKDEPPPPLPPCSEAADGQDCDPGPVNSGDIDSAGICDQQCPEGYILSCGKINGEWANLGCVASGEGDASKGGDEQPGGNTAKDLPKEDWEIQWEKNYEAYHKELDRLAEEKKKEREKDWADWRKHGYQPPKIDFGLQEWRQMSWGEAIVWNKSLRQNLLNLHTLMKNKEHNIKILADQIFNALGVDEDNSYDALRDFYKEQYRQFEVTMKGDPAITVWESYDTRLSEIVDARQYFSTTAAYAADEAGDYFPTKLANPIIIEYWSSESPDSLIEYLQRVQENLRGDGKIDLKLMDRLVDRVQDYNKSLVENGKNIRTINDNLDAVLPREKYDMSEYWKHTINPAGGYGALSEAVMRAKICEEFADQLDEIVKKLEAFKKKIIAEDEKVKAMFENIYARSEELMAWRDNWDDRSKPSMKMMKLQKMQEIALEVGHPLLGKRYAMKGGSLFNRLYDIQRQIKTPENKNGYMVRHNSISMFGNAMFNLRILSALTIQPLLEQKTNEYAKKNGKLPPITPSGGPSGSASSSGGRVKMMVVDRDDGQPRGKMISMDGGNGPGPDPNVLVSFDDLGRAVVNKVLLAQRVEMAQKFLEGSPGLDEAEQVNQFEKLMGECRDLYQLQIESLRPHLKDVAGLHDELISLKKVYTVLPELNELVEEAEEVIAGRKNEDRLSNVYNRMGDIARLAGLQKHPDIAPLIATVQEMVEEMRRNSSAAQGSIRELYNEFARAYQQRDALMITRLLSDEWEADDGTTLDDMEAVLENSFDVFDEIKMTISGLAVQKGSNGLYEATYSTDMRGVIYDNDLQHQEKASIRDTLILTESGPRILKTSGGGFWIR